MKQNDSSPEVLFDSEGNVTAPADPQTLKAVAEMLSETDSSVAQRQKRREVEVMTWLASLSATELAELADGVGMGDFVGTHLELARALLASDHKSLQTQRRKVLREALERATPEDWARVGEELVEPLLHMTVVKRRAGRA